MACATSRGQIVWYALAFENLTPLVKTAIETGDTALSTLSEAQREVWSQLEKNPVSEAVKVTKSYDLVLRKYMAPAQLEAVAAAAKASAANGLEAMKLHPLNSLDERSMLSEEDQLQWHQKAQDRVANGVQVMQQRGADGKTGYDRRNETKTTTMTVYNGEEMSVAAAAVKKQHETMQQMKKKSAPQKEAARLAKEAARRACTNGRLEFSMVQLLTPMDVNGKLSDLGYRTLNPHIDFNRCRKEHRLEKIKMLEQHITDNGLV